MGFAAREYRFVQLSSNVIVVSDLYFSTHLNLIFSKVVQGQMLFLKASTLESDGIVGNGQRIRILTTPQSHPSLPHSFAPPTPDHSLHPMHSLPRQSLPPSIPLISSPSSLSISLFFASMSPLAYLHFHSEVLLTELYTVHTLCHRHHKVMTSHGLGRQRGWPTWVANTGGLRTDCTQIT